MGLTLLLAACGARTELELSPPEGSRTRDASVTRDGSRPPRRDGGSGCPSGSSMWEQSPFSIVPPEEVVGLAAASDGIVTHALWAGPEVAYSRRASADWEARVLVEMSGGFDPALALDAAGTVHAVYRGTLGLMYARGGAGGFDRLLIDGGPEVGLAPSIAIDAGGLVHVTYFARSEGEVRYAQIARDGSARIEVVAGRLAGGTVAIDPSGEPHVLIAADDALWHARRDAGGWVETVVDRGPRLQDESFVFDVDGVGHAAYGAFPEDDARGELRYARFDPATGWHAETIDPAEGGKHTSIAVDGAGIVHIAHWAQPAEDLGYATGVSGSFTTERLDEEGRTGFYPSMIVGPDALQVVYYDFTDRTIRAVTRRCE